MWYIPGISYLSASPNAVEQQEHIYTPKTAITSYLKKLIISLITLKLTLAINLFSLDIFQLKMSKPSFVCWNQTNYLPFFICEIH